jgi:hypothetical protein
MPNKAKLFIFNNLMSPMLDNVSAPYLVFHYMDTLIMLQKAIYACETVRNELIYTGHDKVREKIMLRVISKPL